MMPIFLGALCAFKQPKKKICSKITAFLLLFFGKVYSQNSSFTGDPMPLKGKFNTAGGVDAFKLCNGSYNCAIGYQALSGGNAPFNTRGDSNTAVGANAMYNSSGGRDNVGVGYNALWRNNVGKGNTAVGSNSLKNSLNKDGNTAIGSEALYANSDGAANTALGYRSLVSNINGSGNVAIGCLSLVESQTGNFNTIVGSEALHYNINGSNNCALGNQAGLNNNGSGNVFIGFSAGYNEQGDNKLYISNNQNKPLIYGDFSDVKIGIGTNKANSALSITPSEWGSKITLVDGEDILNHCGFGVSANHQFNYEVYDNSYSHVFYQGGKNGTGMELMRIQGDGKIGIGNSNPQAALDISSTNSGVLLPRLTTLQRDAIALPIQRGMIIYNINTEKLNYYDGTTLSWKEVGGGTANPAGNNSNIQFNNNGSFGAYTNFVWDNNKKMLGIETSTPTATLTVNGNALIGDPSNIAIKGSYKLYVQTGILTEKVTIAASNSTKWADYVFSEKYNLKSFQELKNYIKKNKHLPNIPSAEEITKNGIDLAAMDAKLLEKIEELHLYTLQLEKIIQTERCEKDKLKARLEKIEQILKNKFL